MRIHDTYEWRRLTPADGHYYFGYYDRCPWNQDQSLHLALRIDQCERLPERGERAEIGVVDRAGGYTPLTSTRAWCHQQGCMSLWLKHRPDCFIYNDFDMDLQRLVARIFQLGTGVVGEYAVPIYAMSPDGHWGVSLNFNRIPRRGYSYADAVLPWEPQPDLDQEGLFLVDLHTGAVKLIVSYRQMIALHPVPFDLEDMYIWLNHAIFNCDSSRLLWLFRQCSNPLDPSWRTHMYTANIDGSDLMCPLPHFYWNGMISHQIWGRTPREVLIDATWRGKGAEYVVFDERTMPLQATRISRGMGPMAHLIFSPDGTKMLADSYPDSFGFQQLGLVDVATGGITRLGHFRHFRSKGYCIDTRCDLHPRWSPDGKTVTVDSIHDGRRGIYMLEL